MSNSYYGLNKMYMFWFRDVLEYWKFLVYVLLFDFKRLIIICIYDVWLLFLEYKW